MLLSELVLTSSSVAVTSSRRAKIELLADQLSRLDDHEIAVGVSFLSGELRDRIGIGYATLQKAWPDRPSESPTLTLADVDRTLQDIKSTSGPGSTAARVRVLRDLLERATADEGDFLRRLLLGEIRQGALEGVMVEAIARAMDIPASDVRRAAMLAGDLPAVALAALRDGASGLGQFSIQLFRPIQPMLARPVDGVVEALDRLDSAGLEFKIDGARIQVHRSGGDVAVYTRQLRDVTSAVPEVVEAVISLPVNEIILDGEVIAIRPNGRPHAFQTTMRRFGRKQDVARLQAELPLSPYFFDCLYVDSESFLDRPAVERFDPLSAALPPQIVITRTVTGDAEEAEAFLRSALDAGHEGIMAKALDGAYEAGSRGSVWLKVKPAHTLDLVVLAAEWGHGRRRGWLSNLHLGARDTDTGSYVMLGKTFKGMTDEMLRWQTSKLLELEVARDEWTVYVEPALVVEVAFNDVQASPHYPAGLALRFARVKRYRPDKKPGEADTLETLRAIHGAAN